MTFTQRDGGLVWEDIQYRVDGRILKRSGVPIFDQMEHPNSITPGAKQSARRLDATTIERVSRRNEKVIFIGSDALMPDGKTLLQFVHVFNPDGSLRRYETQVWHRR